MPEFSRPEFEDENRSNMDRSTVDDLKGAESTVAPGIHTSTTFGKAQRLLLLIRVHIFRFSLFIASNLAVMPPELEDDSVLPCQIGQSTTSTLGRMETPVSMESPEV